MLKWLVILVVLAAAVYYGLQEWPSAVSRWNDELSRLTNSPSRQDGLDRQDAPSPLVPPAATGSIAAAGSAAPNGPNAPQPSAPSTVGANSWKEQTVGGLMLSLPMAVQLYNPPQAKTPPPNIFVEYFKGQNGGLAIFVSHAMSSTLVGGPMLAWANKPLSSEATRQGLQVMSLNSATTLINGLRARRSDYVSAQGVPRIRARCVLLERASQVWLIEYHSPENDPGAERTFLTIATSAREL